MRSESFCVEAGTLSHAVVPDPARGKPYVHRCPLPALEAVAHAIDDAGADGITQPGVRAATGLPWTRIDVALAFLLERGCVERAYRRRYRAASGDTYLDAMIEYHALREKGPAAGPARPDRHPALPSTRPPGRVFSVLPVSRANAALA